MSQPRNARKRPADDDGPPPPKKHRLDYQESKSPTNEMIQLIQEQSGADKQTPLKFHRKRLLSVQLKQSDPRNSIVVRNSLESPMLALPPEIRNRIFEYALGGQHIHITTDPYPEEVKASNTWSPPAWLHGIPGFKTLSNRFSSNVEPTVRNLPGPSRFTLREAFSSRNDHEPTVSKFYNCVYPLDWQSYYSLIELPIDLNTLPDWRRLQHGRGIEPDIRVIKASNDHMTLVSAVCRQMYHETKFLPYKLNEFSFQDVGTMKDWFVNRGAAQKRMLQTIWLDLEWFCLCEDIIDFGRYMFGPASGLTTIRVSTLALIRVLEAYDNHPNPGMRSLLVNRLGDVQLRLRRTLRQNGDERPLQIKVVI